MTFVTHMSRRDNAVTPENVTRDFGVSHGHVTATRPDPTRPDPFSPFISLSVNGCTRQSGPER